jgi:hypothetical protein
MGIKPIDHQVIIPKSQEVGKIKQDEDNKHVVNQQQGSEKNQKTVGENLKRITKKEELSQERVKGNMEDDKDEKRKDKKKKKQPKDENKGSVVDVKI